MISCEDLEIIEEYARCEGTEVGEMLNLLLGLYNRRDYISDELAVAVEQELIYNLEDFKENYEIVEETETYTHKYKILREK